MISGSPPEARFTIKLWYGLAANVPPGWQICDGTNGTPDPRNLYIKGNDLDGNLGNVGGNLTHTHSIVSHNHTLQVGAGVAGGGGFSPVTTGATPVINSSNHEPPYCKVWYIMKL